MLKVRSEKKLADETEGEGEVGEKREGVTASKPSLHALNHACTTSAESIGTVII